VQQDEVISLTGGWDFFHPESL